MDYLSGGLFHRNKSFPVTFIGPNVLFPWLLVFSYLTDAFVLAHVVFTTYIHIFYVAFWMLLLLLLLCRTSTTSLQYLSLSEEILLSLYHYYMLALLPNDSSQSLQPLRSTLRPFPWLLYILGLWCSLCWNDADFSKFCFKFGNLDILKEHIKLISKLTWSQLANVAIVIDIAK